MAENDYTEAQELKETLIDLRKQLIHRAILAWHRSPETFGEEITTFNDVDKAIRNLGV